MSAPTFTNDELQQQAQGNALVMLLATIAYFKQVGSPFSDWVRFASEKLTPGWREAADFDALQLGRVWALNFVSVGATVVSLDGDARRAEGVITNWPGDDDLSAFGLSREDVDAFLEIGIPLIASVGANLTWSRSGDRITYVITR